MKPRHRDASATPPSRAAGLLPALLVAALAATSLTAGCERRPDDASSAKHRAFDEVFPDVTELLTTPDPGGAAEELAACELPDDDAHEARLVDLLRSAPSLDAAHLFLLASAARRDETVDTLLLEGAAKLGPLQPESAGLLLGLARDEATLGALADVLLPAADDGTADALRAILQGMAGSPMRTPFVVKVLAAGALDGERADVAMMALGFDEDRLALLRARIEATPSVSFDFLIEQMPHLSFDEGRLSLLRLALPHLEGKVDGAHLEEILRRLAFEESRVEAIGAAAEAGRLDLSFGKLADLLRPLGDDDRRTAALEKMAPALSDAPTALTAGATLRAFESDAGRIRALGLLASKLRSLSASDREQLVRNVSEERRAEAAAALAAPAHDPAR